MKRVTDKDFRMDGLLIDNLNTICYNLQDDWDLIGIISGSGLTRIGKSYLAQQVAYYVAHKLNTPFSIKNIVYSGEELKTVAKELPKNSVIIYDEARGGLDSKKVMEHTTKGIMDFFSECGYLNHFFILVLPEYFDLPKGIAINRSKFLINCIYQKEEKKDKQGDSVSKWARGLFRFYGEKKKKQLYMIGKKAFNDYDAVKSDFWGEFPNFCIIPKDEYDKKKQSYVMRGHTKEEDRFTSALKLLSKHYTQRDLAREFKALGVKITQGRISQMINQK